MAGGWKTVRISLAVVLCAATLSMAQTFRYLKIAVNNDSPHLDEHTFGVVEAVWFVGNVGFPVTKMTSDNSPAPLRAWFERDGAVDQPASGYPSYRMYDGELGDTSRYTVEYKSTYATIGLLPYPFAWVLDLGEGNGIAPDSVWIRGLKDDRRWITELKCYGSNDNENWILLGEAEEPSYVENGIPLENSGGGALSLLSPAKGAVYWVGETIRFMWYVNPDSVSGDIELAISPDSGGQWLTLPAVDQQSSQYDWVIPATHEGQDLASDKVAVSIMETGNPSSRKAVYGIRINPAGTKPFIVDSEDPEAEVIGDWAASSALSGFEGNNYLWDNGAPKTGKKVIYKPTIQLAGEYAIYGKWTAANNRAKAAPYIIETVGGQQTVTVNQEENGGEWVLLDTFALAVTSGSPVVTISAEGTPDLEEHVVADAVRFEYIRALSSHARRPASPALRPAAASRGPRFGIVRSGDAIHLPAGVARVAVFDLRGRIIARYVAPDRGAAWVLRLPRHASGVVGVARY
jgi:hypothetical protein